MTEPSPDVDRWLPAARAGSQAAMGELLETCRSYLLLLAERELAPDLRVKGGASDLVQETMLDALRDFGRFQGETTAELRAWLRRMLLNNLVSFARQYRATDKRQVGREVGLRAGSSAAAAGLEPSAGSLTPSGHAVAREEAEALHQALDRLPEDYRLAVLLRYQEQRSFDDIGRLLDLTPNAARKLWLRAVRRLQQEAEKPP